MNNIFGLILAGAAILALAPSPAVTKTMLPSCKGRVVWMIPGKMYVLSNNPRYGRKPGSYACEARAVALRYHMRPLQTMHPVMRGTPMPNPSGYLNADKGATPNPMNDQNGVHTTAAPPATPRP